VIIFLKISHFFAVCQTNISKPKNEAMFSYIDLSHIIENELITYKGLPAPIICDYLSREESRKYYEEGTEFQIAKIEMVSNTGTYLDCPFHRFAEGGDMASLALSQLADLEGVVIDVGDSLAISPLFFESVNLKDKAVIVRTGWSRHWNTAQYYENHPFLTAESAQYLVESGAKLVGIDSHNIDDTRYRSRPVHTILLQNEVLIVEHLCNLEALPMEGFLFSAVPPKWKGVGTFPVRAFAKLLK
jgi:arylformamidase